MARLGYDRYGVQGGDVGAFVAPVVGRLGPERVVGVHVNALVTFPSGDPPSWPTSPRPSSSAWPGCGTSRTT
jgi:hypothetical protein